MMLQITKVNFFKNFFNHFLEKKSNKHKKIYGWGNGSYGQLGIPGSYNQKNIKPLKLDGYDFVWISTATYHSAAIDNNKKVYVWGLKSYFPNFDADGNQPPDVLDQTRTIIKKPSQYDKLGKPVIEEQVSWSKIFCGENVNIAFFDDKISRTANQGVYWRKWSSNQEQSTFQFKILGNVFKYVALSVTETTDIIEENSVSNKSIYTRDFCLGPRHCIAIDNTVGAVYTWGEDKLSDNIASKMFSDRKNLSSAFNVNKTKNEDEFDPKYTIGHLGTEIKWIDFKTKTKKRGKYNKSDKETADSKKSLAKEVSIVSGLIREKYNVNKENKDKDQNKSVNTSMQGSKLNGSNMNTTEVTDRNIVADIKWFNKDEVIYEDQLVYHFESTQSCYTETIELMSKIYEIKKKEKKELTNIKQSFFGRITKHPFNLHEKMSIDKFKSDPDSIHGKFHKWDYVKNIEFIVDDDKTITIEDKTKIGEKFRITDKIIKHVPLEIQGHKPAYVELFTG